MNKVSMIVISAVGSSWWWHIVHHRCSMMSSAHLLPVAYGFSACLLPCILYVSNDLLHLLCLAHIEFRIGFFWTEMSMVCWMSMVECCFLVFCKLWTGRNGGFAGLLVAWLTFTSLLVVNFWDSKTLQSCQSRAFTPFKKWRLHVKFSWCRARQRVVLFALVVYWHAFEILSNV